MEKDPAQKKERVVKRRNAENGGGKNKNTTAPFRTDRESRYGKKSGKLLRGTAFSISVFYCYL